MRRRRETASYTLSQILLHWAIAALVLWQLVFGESLPKVEHMTASGETVGATDAFLASSHLWAGFAILGLVIIRLALRLRRGAVPAEGTPLAALAARIMHDLFYVLLFLMPITGIGAYFFDLPTGEIHELGKPVLIVLIAGHVAAALWHLVLKRDGTMRRMLVPVR